MEQNNKQKRRDACASVTSGMLLNVRNNLLIWINKYLQIHDRHFKHVIIE